MLWFITGLFITIILCYIFIINPYSNSQPPFLRFTKPPTHFPSSYYVVSYFHSDSDTILLLFQTIRSNFAYDMVGYNSDVPLSRR